MVKAQKKKLQNLSNFNKFRLMITCTQLSMAAPNGLKSILDRMIFQQFPLAFVCWQANLVEGVPC